MKKTHLLSCFLVLLSLCTMAQDTDFDVAFDAYADGDYKKSIAYYSSYLEDNESINAHYNRGLAYHETGDYEEAIADYTYCISEDPTDPDAFYSRARSYYSLEDYPNAIEDNKEAIRLNNKYENAYTNLGLCYEKIGDDELAIKQYTQAIDLDPYSGTDYYNRALSYQNLGDYSNAEEDFSEAIYLEDYDYENWWGRAYLYYDLSEMKDNSQSEKEEYLWKCINDYDEAIYLENSVASLFYNRGKAYYDLEDFENGLIDFDEADYLYGDDIDAKWYIVLCAKELGDNEKALKYYDEVIRIDPHYEYLSSLDRNDLEARNFLDGIFDFKTGDNNIFYIIALGILVIVALILFGKLFGGNKDEQVRRRQ